MAKIKAHGTIVGTVYLTTHAKRYMSDGKILVNRGFGWKLGSPVKPELAHLTPAELHQRQVAHQANYDREHPEAAVFRKLLHDTAPLSKRWKILAVIQMMPDDPDGVWSECCDGYGDNIHADLDDIVQLCAAYRLMEKVEKERRLQRAA